MTFPKVDFKRIFFIILGTFILAVCTNGILIPNSLLSGGVNGIAIFLHFLFDFNISIVISILNIPLFILAFFFLKKNFITYSLIGITCLSIWLQVTKGFTIATGNLITVILVGGALSGIGNGIIFRANGSTGGLDIIAKIVNKYFSLSMATVTFSINGIILILSMLYFGLDLSVLTLAIMFVSSKITNFVVDGLNYKRTLFIITDAIHYQDIADHIIKDLNRGVTVIPAIGAYTKDAKYILYTNIGIRQVASAKNIILSHDPKAFMTVSETAQVIGKGRGFLMPNAD
jgi:uncharacterized membrane-anchored protein YitT (DUF2179 family)